MSYSFKTFSEASIKAKALAIDGCKNVRVVRCDEGFSVLTDTIDKQSSNDVAALIIAMIEDAKTYTETKKDCDEYIAELTSLISQSIEVDLKLISDAKRTIRELEELKLTLPSDIEKDNQKFNKEKMALLNRNPPICRIHNIKMVLRESENSYFWGCPNFTMPAHDKCFQTKRLNKEELSILYD